LIGREHEVGRARNGEAVVLDERIREPGGLRDRAERILRAGRQHDERGAAAP
jgi:hypothetical protein